MGLFKRKKPDAKSAASITATPQLVEILRMWNGAAGSYAAIYRQLPPVRTVVDFLSDAVSTTSLKVYRRTADGRPEARDHPLAVLLRHPHPRLSQRSLIANTVHDLALYANAYWLKIEAPSGRMLMPVPPARVVPRGGDMISPDRYEIWPVAFDTVGAFGTRAITVGAEEMVHFRTYDPEDRRIGTSKLEALRQILAEEVEASRNRESFWKNAARREGVIERPGDAPPWSDDARKRFREDWQARTSGPTRGGIAPVLEEGMTWNPDTFSPKEAEFLEGRKFVLEATARVYNVPLPLLSLTETATYASQREFHKALYVDTLPPYFELLQSEIELQLLPWFDSSLDPSIYVEFNVESKLRGSFEEQASVLSTAVGPGVAWMSVHEARDRQNLPSRHDPLDDELARPLNITFGAPPEPVAPAPPAAVPALPAAASRDILAIKRTLDREVHAALERMAKGEEFDFDRWNRQLAAVTGQEASE